MLCERCKIREATIKYTEIINGIKTEHNLCSHCAKEMDFGQYSALLDGEFPLGKLLSGLLGLEDDEEETDVRESVVCPSPAPSRAVKTAGSGCADCYGVFDLFIKDKMKQLPGKESHKHPKYRSTFKGGPRQPELWEETKEAQTVWVRPVPRIPRPLWPESRSRS